MENDTELPPNPDVPLSKEISALRPDVVHKICADRVCMFAVFTMYWSYIIYITSISMYVL
jgi:hypothetical protein